MGIRIERTVDYWAESVACFDPEKLSEKVIDAFPTATFDPIDYAEEELRRFERYANEHIKSETLRATMIRQLTGKARRNGPIYRFYLNDPKAPMLRGHVARYSVVFKSVESIPSDTHNRIIRFLDSLDLGKTTIDNNYVETH